MTEGIIIGAVIPIVLAIVGAAYKLGYDRRKRTNGNGKIIDLDVLMTKELCVERHKALSEKLDEIHTRTECLPKIEAWIDLQKRS